MDSLSAEEERAERRHDIKWLIEQAKQKGLILTSNEARAVSVAADRRRRVATPIDKTDGELVSNLAGVQTRWMDVSPAMAELWLKNNFGNRKVSLDTVKAYARDMMNMKWLPTHQGLAFNNKDELIDGQHRLLAIVLSRETVRMMVTFGLPSRVEGTRMTAMDTVDRGKTRTVADQLKVQHGIGQGTILTAVCTRIAGICSPERTRRLNVGEILDIHQTFEEAVDYVIANRPKGHGLRQAGVLGGFAFALAVDGLEHQVASMFTELTQGTAQEGSPMQLLHSFLTGPEAILLSRGNDRALSELVLQAIWLQSEGRFQEILEHNLDGVRYYREQQPERVQRVAGMFMLPQDTKLEDLLKSAA